MGLAYLDHAEIYYRLSNERKHIKRCLQPISDLYADLDVEKFGPLQFEAVRNWWLITPSGKKPKREGDPNPTVSRWYCNAQMKRLLRVIRWGVSKGMVSASIHQTLKCVEPLKRGRVDAPEMEPVKPVDTATIQATIKHLTAVVADMVQVQLLLGCRPGELCKITPAMINRSQEVWEINLNDHKTAYRGKSRTIYAGPQAQAILTRYLLRDAADPLFSPLESEKQRRAAMHAERVTLPSCGNSPGKNRKAKPMKKPGKAFTSASYSKAITNAAEKAKVDRWTANQLRHARATEIRAKFGLVVRQVQELGFHQLAVWALAPVFCDGTVANAKTANPKSWI